MNYTDHINKNEFLLIYDCLALDANNKILIRMKF